MRNLTNYLILDCKVDVNITSTGFEQTTALDLAKEKHAVEVVQLINHLNKKVICNQKDEEDVETIKEDIEIDKP